MVDKEQPELNTEVGIRCCDNQLNSLYTVDISEYHIGSTAIADTQSNRNVYS